MRILMVCLGNICRSPLAHGILDHKLQKRNLQWTVDSAGTGGYHVGELPDARSQAVAMKRGIDLNYQQSRKFIVADFDAFDIIYAMDATNYNDILRQARSEEDKNKVRMIMNETEPGRNIQVPDPYYGDDGFENVYDMLDRATDSIITKFAQ